MAHTTIVETNAPCTLIYFIDDATNIVTSVRFEISESLEGYFEVLKAQIENYCFPRSIYTDRFSVFETRCNKENLTPVLGFTEEHKTSVVQEIMRMSCKLSLQL